MNKSEELAKLLGIEPKIRQTILSCLECKYKSSKNCPDDESAECPEMIENKYPDFTKPSNFVKLLELAFKNNCLDLHYLDKDINTFTDSYLNYLLIILTNPVNKFEFKNFISQAQQIEWDY